METKYYVDSNGNYLGGFCGYQPPPLLVEPEEGESYFEDQPFVMPKIPQGAIEVATAPNHSLDKWVNGAWVAHVPLPTKSESLSSITVTTQAGNTFDGNETARNNMMSAIMAAEIVGQSQSNWKLADNTVAHITLNELKEALALSIQRVGEIVLAN